MDATSIDCGGNGPDDWESATSGSQDAGEGNCPLSGKWSALHDAAATVAAIAGEADAPLAPYARDFVATIRRLGGWRLNFAEQGIDDLTAIMESGLAALLTALGRGVNPAPAAHALWCEFTAARDALFLGTLPPR